MYHICVYVSDIEIFGHFEPNEKLSESEAYIFKSPYFLRYKHWTLRHYATSRMVAGLIADEFIEFFN
jgi:hypothetical protein